MAKTTEALAGFLDAIEFDYFCTFTTRKPTSVAGCRRIAEATARHIAAGDLSTMFWAAEPFDARGGEKVHLRYADDLGKWFNDRRYHFHALLKFPDPYFMNSIQLWDWFYTRYGRCQIINNQEREVKLAASWYLSKYTTKKLADYDIYPGRTLKSLPLFDRR